MTATKEEVWEILSAPAGLKRIELGDVIPIDEFVHNCECGWFINDDGFGEWATATHYDSRVWVHPSAVKNEKIVPPKWATHVVWYNK